MAASAWDASPRDWADEIKQAVERARAIPLPDGREVLHLLPQEFILDDQAGYRSAGHDGGATGGAGSSGDGGSECDPERDYGGEPRRRACG